MEMKPALPWQSISPSVCTPKNKSTRQGNARGASEVRRGTAYIHFHQLSDTLVVQSCWAWKKQRTKRHINVHGIFGRFLVDVFSLLQPEWPQKKHKQILPPINPGTTPKFIDIYLAVGPFAAANSAMFNVLPSFMVKMAKEMLQICPIAVRSWSIEMTPNWLETAIPSPFSKKVIGTAISGLCLGSFGFKCEMCWPFWPQKRFKLQIC